jgi:prepilin-type N-terminal cleavage/methylation domain-containing protein
MKKIFRNAFTLAETMVVLLVIGIVTMSTIGIFKFKRGFEQKMFYYSALTNLQTVSNQQIANGQSNKNPDITKTNITGYTYNNCTNAKNAFIDWQKAKAENDDCTDTYEATNNCSSSFMMINSDGTYLSGNTVDTDYFNITYDSANPPAQAATGSAAHNYSYCSGGSCYSYPYTYAYTDYFRYCPASSTSSNYCHWFPATGVLITQSGASGCPGYCAIEAQNLSGAATNYENILVTACTNVGGTNYCLKHKDVADDPYDININYDNTITDSNGIAWGYNTGSTV